MADETHRGIDRAYDFAERVVDGLGRTFGVDTSSAPALRTISTTVTKEDRRVLAGKRTMLLPASPIVPAAFRIDEVIEDGVKIWIVTNGIERADCKSRAFADQMLKALVKLGAAK